MTMTPKDTTMEERFLQFMRDECLTWEFNKGHIQLVAKFARAEVERREKELLCDLLAKKEAFEEALSLLPILLA